NVNKSGNSRQWSINSSQLARTTILNKHSVHDKSSIYPEMRCIFVREIYSMNWKLIVILGLLGPILAVAGNYGYVSFNAEPYVALVILFVSAILFSVFKTGKYFLHGFATALLFGFLMTAIRLEFMQQYIYANPDSIDKGENFLHRFHYIRSPFIIIGILVFITSIISGIMAWVAGFFSKKIRT